MPIEKSTQSNKIKINTISLIRSNQTQRYDLTNLIKIFKIEWSMHKLFPTCKMVIQSQGDFVNDLKSSDRIRISYQTGLIDNYYDARDIIFKITNVKNDMVGQSIPVHVFDFDMIDESYYDLSYGRYNKKYDDTKLNILSDIFTNYGFTFNGSSNDNDTHSFYMLKSKINKDIRYIRLLGDDPLFLYKKMNDSTIYARDIDTLLDQKIVTSLKSDKSVGKNAPQMMRNVNDVIIHNFFDQSEDASGYKLYTVDENSKTFTTSNRYIQNDELYNVDRISSMKMTESCAYKEKYYLTKNVSFDYPYANTSLNVGDAINFILTKSYDSSEKTVISDKYIIFGLEETINMENLTINQNMVIFKK